MPETQQVEKLHLLFSEFDSRYVIAAQAMCELHPEWGAKIFMIHDSLIVDYTATFGKDVILGIAEALGKCEVRPAKIGSRMVPTQTDIAVRGESRPFRTIMKTVKRFGVKYYGDTIMARDLGFDAFQEELGKKNKTYKKVNGITWTGRTRKG
jgi:hypothetical protein